MEISQKEELFDTLFTGKGGLLRYENLPNPLPLIYGLHKKMADEIIRSANRPGLSLRPAPDIYFGFIDNDVLNAVAAMTDKNVFLIGINSGSILILYDIFYRMLSNPSVLTKIGNPNEEIKDLPTIRNYYSNAGVLFSVGRSSDKPSRIPVPKNATRSKYARHLTHMATNFLILHEMTHIINGHVEYINSNTGLSLYNENDIEAEGKVNVLTIQTLEMDADCVAISIGLSNQIKCYLGEQSVNEQFAEFYDDFNRVIFDFCIAFGTLVRILAESRRYQNLKVKIDDHFHPRVRVTALLATVDEFVKRIYPQLYRSFDQKNIFQEVIAEIESTYQIITGNKIDKEGIFNALETQKYSSSIHKHWEEIKPDLNKFAYGKLV